MIKSQGIENLRTVRVRLNFGLGFGGMSRSQVMMLCFLLLVHLLRMLENSFNPKVHSWPMSSIFFQWIFLTRYILQDSLEKRSDFQDSLEYLPPVWIWIWSDTLKTKRALQNNLIKFKYQKILTIKLIKTH